ncbi:MAG: glycosyltransferase family 2 protein [Candidatus Altarchaeum sp.]|nr:glycosyltransferase family 2 protein [Candidatus Altarchaeum sp.]
MDKKISIVIPAYNEEKYIETTLSKLKEIRNKEYENLEVIVAENGSIDRTYEIAKQYADRDKNFKAFHLDKASAAIATNFGAKNATGEILILMDADTYPLDGAISEIAEKFEKNNNVVNVCTYVKTNSSTVNNLLFSLSSELAYLSSKINHPLFYTICVAYRKDIFEQLNGLKENFVTAYDLDLSKRASKFGKCVFARKANVFTSARRVEKGGTANIIMYHLKNFIKFFIYKKPSDDYKPYR